MTDYNNTFRLTVNFSNNNVEFLERINNILGLERTIHHKKGSKNYVMILYHNNLRWLLPQLSLVTKEHKRQVGIQYLSLLSTRGKSFQNREEFYSKLRECYDNFYKYDRNH